MIQTWFHLRENTCSCFVHKRTCAVLCGGTPNHTPCYAKIVVLVTTFRFSQGSIYSLITCLGRFCNFKAVNWAHLHHGRLVCGNTFDASRTSSSSPAQPQFVVPPHCAHEDQPHGCLCPPELEVVPLDGKSRVHFVDGRQERSFFFSTTSSGQNS